MLFVRALMVGALNDGADVTDPSSLSSHGVLNRQMVKSNKVSFSLQATTVSHQRPEPAPAPT